MKRALIKLAYEEAAAQLESAMDDVDLPSDLSEEDESAMREYIRVVIVGRLRSHAKGVKEA